ncbi:response regulator [Sinimarinibacterium sp. CAU 1509]|uniref:response regulator n=1 Tax=Sinimarinibacterium sp. CAU 1509 TaxID=2562283 RepID=UPI0010AB8B27|nr:response regulator [Sinimarinibacterium sp. CAU 1509]TJY61994.1 response regulator [Sinimarinibacterium sp. CAU 1509]
MARVMIVDDSPTDVQNLRTMLQKAGHSVLEATTGQDAIERVRVEKPEVVIMDVVMPGVNGFQATRSLSKDPATAHIPVIVVSSKNQETDRVWALRQGAREYLVKPVREADLLAKINSVLGR